MNNDNTRGEGELEGVVGKYSRVVVDIFDGQADDTKNLFEIKC